MYQSSWSPSVRCRVPKQRLRKQIENMRYYKRRNTSTTHPTGQPKPEKTQKSVIVAPKHQELLLYEKSGAVHRAHRHSCGLVITW